MYRYCSTICQNIVETKYAAALKKKFGRYTVNCYDKLYQWNDYYPSTPRLRAVSGILPCASFFYTEFLLEINPDHIYDIGCGMNFFKDILPGVIGIDAYGSDYDIKDLFDDHFVAAHENRFQAAMSIDALHFISIDKFTQRVMDFSRCIADRGRGYLAMNAARMTEHTPQHTLIKTFGCTRPQINEIHDFFDDAINQLPLDFIVKEILIDERFDDCMDGNIRLVFQK